MVSKKRQFEQSEEPAKVVGGQYQGRELSVAELRELERTLPKHQLPILVFRYEHSSGHRFRMRPYRFAPSGATSELADGHLTITD